MSPERALGPYRLGARLAVGGMAEIHAARRADGRGPPRGIKRRLPPVAPLSPAAFGAAQE